MFVPDVGWLAWDGARWDRESGKDRLDIAAQRAVQAIDAEARAVVARDPARPQHSSGMPATPAALFALPQSAVTQAVRCEGQVADRAAEEANGRTVVAASPAATPKRFVTRRFKPPSG